MPSLRLFAPCWAVAALMALPAPAADSTKVEAMQSVVTDWARVRHEKIRLESQWDGDQDLLRSMETALEAQRLTLDEQKRSLTSQLLGQKTVQTELSAKNQAMKTSLATAGAEVDKLSDELLRLRPRLPPRLSRGLEMAFRSLATPETPLAERSQHLVTILTRCVQFNQAITWGEEPVVLPAGSGEKLIEVVYWGLSCGYGLDRAAGKAYVGRPDGDGWAWQEKPGIAGAVAELIAQARDKGDPRLIALPVRAGTLPRN